MIDLSGKKAFVFGGSSGIGGAISSNLNLCNCEVLVIGRSKEKFISLQKKAFNKKNLYFYNVDLLKETNLNYCLNEIHLTFGTPDIIIHNIGGALGIKNLYTPFSEWTDLIRFNFGVSVDINNFFVPKLIDKGWGRVVHLSSISSKIGEPKSDTFQGSIQYASVKSMLNAYCQGLSREVSSKGVLVNAVLPGPVISEGKFWHKLKKSNNQLYRKYVDQYVSINRLALPEEIAKLVIFLVSDLNTYMAGSLVNIDGGRFS